MSFGPLAGVPTVDWSGRDLRGKDLRRNNLRNYDLRGANLSGADLSGALLRGARLDEAKLRGTNLSDCELDRASLCQADATEARFDRTTATWADAESLVAERASFRGAEWFNARLDLAQLSETVWSGARLDRASLLGTNFSLARMDRAVLDDCDLDGATFHASRARGVALLRARGRFRFDQADFSQSDLRGILLADQRFENAKLDGCFVDERLNRGSRVQLAAQGWESPIWSRGRRGIWTGLRAGAWWAATTTRAVVGWSAAKIEAWRTEPAEGSEAESVVEGADLPDTHEAVPATEGTEAPTPNEPEPESTASQLGQATDEPRVGAGGEPRPEGEQAVEEESDDEEDDPNLAYAAFDRAQVQSRLALRREAAARLGLARRVRHVASTRRDRGAHVARAWAGTARRLAREILLDPEPAADGTSGPTVVGEAFLEQNELRSDALQRAATRRELRARRAVRTHHQRVRIAAARARLAGGQTVAGIDSAIAAAEARGSAGLARPAVVAFAGESVRRLGQLEVERIMRFSRAKTATALARNQTGSMHAAAVSVADQRAKLIGEADLLRLTQHTARMGAHVRARASVLRGVAARPDLGRSTRRLAEQARRAQQARDAERGRLREDAELHSLELALAVVQARLRSAQAEGWPNADCEPLREENERLADAVAAQRAAVLSAAARAHVAAALEVEALPEEPATEGNSSLRYVGVGLAVAASSMLATYLADRFADERGLNPAAVEDKAIRARQSGDDAAAATAFADLAAQADRADSKVDFLIEAAASAQDAGDGTRALSLLEEAVGAATGTTELPRALLARAVAWRRLDLRARAEGEFRSLLARGDLAPDQVAASVGGLRATLDEGGETEIQAAQDRALRSCSTDQERGSLAFALADMWTATGDPEAAVSALAAALALIDDPRVSSEVRLRTAQVWAEGGEVDLALNEYRTLVGGVSGANASLGAAELLLRTGRDDEARTLLEPLYIATDHDIRARALRARAGMAERAGDNSAALASVRQILELDGVPSAVLDEARILLARLDPSAVEEIVGDNQALRAELLLGRARALNETGKRTDAREIWVELAEDPQSSAAVRADASLSLAEMQVEDGDGQGAVRRYDAMLREALPTDLRERISLARSSALSQIGKIQEAEAGFLALRAAASPEIRPQCDLGLARVAEKQGQVSRAAELYASVGRSEGPWALEALLSLGELREKSGDYAEAAAAYRLARNRPGDRSRRTAADVALAEVLTEMGDPGASAVYATLLTSSDPAVRVASRLAVANGKLGANPAEALELYDQALADAVPGELRTQVRAGWIAATVAKGDTSGARTRFAAWFDTEPDAAERESLAANALRALRAGGAGTAAAELALSYAGSGFEAAIEAALSLREVGEQSKAAAILQATKATTPEDERWRKELLAEILVEADELDAADAVWKSLGEGETKEAARFGRARVARARGDNQTALTLLEGLSDPRVPAERALALEGLDRLEEAETLYLRLADAPLLETKSAGVVGIARVRLARDDAAGALSALARIPTIDAGYALTAAQLRGDALLALGRVAEARDVYRGLDQDAEARTIRSLGLGECALADEDAARALALFSTAYANTDDAFYRAAALAGGARAWAEAGDVQRAKEELQKLRSQYPQRLDAIALAEAAIGR